jgi:hypothetical protein
LGAFAAKIQLQDFCVPKVDRTALPGEFRVDVPSKTVNSENATNMSFGSNGLDWVRSLRKNSTADFSFQKWLERSSRANFRTVVPSKPKRQKRNKHESLVKRVDWVRSLRKIQLQDFSVPKVARTSSRASFSTMFRRKP